MAEKNFVRLDKTKRKIWTGPVSKGAVCIKNLPHGFYERSIYNFFNQFGDISRYKVARSNKNAKPMGFAYIEFDNSKVAKIVSNTMNNYLMFNKIIKCRYIAADNIKDKMFANSKLHPEFCTGTKRKLRNQYKMEHVDEASLKIKLKRKASLSLRKLSKVLGMKIKREPEMTAAKLEVEIDSEVFSKAEQDSNASDVDYNEESSISPKSKKRISRRSKEDFRTETLIPVDGKSSLQTPRSKKKQSTVAETPLVMEIDEVDEEIYVKTPPNVIKVIKRGEQKVICDVAATTVKRPIKKIKLGPLENVTNKLFCSAKDSSSVRSPKSRRRNKKKGVRPVSAAISVGSKVVSKKVQKTAKNEAVQPPFSESNKKTEKSTNEVKKIRTMKKNKAKKGNKGRDLASMLTDERCVNVSEKRAEAESKKEKRKSSSK